MSAERDVLDADSRFFAALLRADGDALEEILVDDFVIVDVLSGGRAGKSDLVRLVTSGALTFDEIEPDATDREVRLYGSAAVVVGRTRMSGRYEDQPWSAASRYTHIFVEGGGVWRLASAQGTPVAG